MLHSANESLLTKLVPLLDKAGYTALPYTEYYDRLRRNSLPENPILISIDNIGTSWLNPAYIRMIDTMNEFNMRGTIGIVTRGAREDVHPEIWEYLKKIADSGWELALHTEDHAALGPLSERVIRYQVGECYYKITQATGLKPKTLILPYGSWTIPNTDTPNSDILKVARDFDLVWVVGIKGGKEIVGKPPYYVGRIPPAKDAPTTITWLENSFNKNTK